MMDARSTIKSKLDSLLISAKTKSIDEARKLCLSLDGMDGPSRRQFIREHWGDACLGKVEPLLIQLDSAEVA